MGTNNLVFLEVIEWFDETGRNSSTGYLRRAPEKSSMAAQLIVRESQASRVLLQRQGLRCLWRRTAHANHCKHPDPHKVASLPWGFTSPLRAEVYFGEHEDFS